MCLMMFNNKCLIVWTAPSYNLEHHKTCLTLFENLAASTQTTELILFYKSHPCLYNTEIKGFIQLSKFTQDCMKGTTIYTLLIQVSAYGRLLLPFHFLLLMTNEIVVYAEIADKMSVSSILCELRHLVSWVFARIFVQHRHKCLIMFGDV